MSKLYFYYGTVCSSKTLNLLAVYKNYEIQGRKAVLIRPSVDTRTKEVASRAGMHAIPDIILNQESSIFDELKKYINKKNVIPKVPELLINEIDAILVDECQFLSTKQINELRQIAIGVTIHFTDVTKTSNSEITKITKQTFNNAYNKN